MKKLTKRREQKSVNPLVMAIKKASPVAPDVVQRLRFREWSAIEAFAKGQATSIDVALMEELLCMCQCSIQLGIGPEAQDSVNAASTVLATVKARTEPNMPMRMNEAEVAILQDLQAFHDQQRALCNRGDYSRMADLVVEAVALNIARIDALPAAAGPTAA